MTPQQRLEPYKLTDQVILDGLTDDFAERLYLLLSDPRLEHRVSIVSAFRTYEQQKALYDAWRAGLHNVPVVARPGTSRHETGRAADLDIGWGAPYRWAHVHAVSAEYGLHYPVRSENWHVETHPGAERLPPPPKPTAATRKGKKAMIWTCIESPTAKTSYLALDGIVISLHRLSDTARWNLGATATNAGDVTVEEHYVLLHGYCGGHARELAPGVWGR